MVDKARDTLKIECFLQAIEEYFDAKRECDKARDEYDGRSWGYYGSHLIDSVAEKAAEVEDSLIDVIRSVDTTGQR